MSINYIELLKSIQNQKCALVLGPNACLTEDGKTTFAVKIANKIQEARKPVKYYPKDDLYFIKERTDRTWTSNLIQDEVTLAVRDLNNPGFYFAPYKSVIELPFHFILSLSPDKFLFHWMKYNGIDAQFASFSITDQTASFEKPTPEKPLIFNLLGETNKTESLILTQEDFYNYLSEVFTNPKKLEELRKYLRDISHLVFIGVPLDRWYVKLLMLLLRINSDSPFITFATNPDRDNLKKTDNLKMSKRQLVEFEDFCSKHYKITFAENNFLEFLDALYQEAVIQAARPNAIISLRKTLMNSIERPRALKKKYSVAVSYAPDEKSVEIATRIIKELEEKDYEVLNEKISLAYRGNLQNFIERMGSGRAVITILSDMYLKDKNCMGLALEMEKKQNLADRIFPIVLEDANIYDAVTRLRYRTFWQNKIDELNKELQNIPDKAYLKTVNAELDQYSEIKRFIDAFIGIVNGMMVLTPDIHKGENFQSLFKDLGARFENDLQIPEL